jgi:hypothetical protein
MTRRRAFDAWDAKAEVLIEHCQQLAGTECAHLGSRQLDGQREAVERMAYRGNGLAVVIDELVVRPFGRAADEQLHRRKSDGLIRGQDFVGPR